MSDSLVATGLSRTYGTVHALRDVDLTVTPGEVVGLLGPNGAGKSTAFRLLAGLERPDAGRVLLGGVDVTTWPLHRRARAGLAFLPQHQSLLPRLTACENVAVALSAVGRPRGDALDLLNDAGLGQVADRKAEALSGGERRRVEIVRSLALEPKWILLDEPFAGVDPTNVGVVKRRIRALAAEGRGVLLTDHAVREAMATCDRVCLLDAGVIQICGTPQEVARDSRSRDRYLGADFQLDLHT